MTNNTPRPLGVLDEFKSAGIFVNWWQQIRYDLKTIISTGWHHTLIPDAYLIAAFFQAQADAIEALEPKISEIQSELAEAVETAQDVAAYEPAEDETVTAAVIKKALKELIDGLKDSTGESAQKKLKALQAQEKTISALGLFKQPLSPFWRCCVRSSMWPWRFPGARHCAQLHEISSGNHKMSGGQHRYP